MSKSLANFETAHNLLAKYSPQSLRFYLLSAHYRTPLDYSNELLNQSAAAVRRIKEFIDKLDLVTSSSEDNLKDKIKSAEDKFESAMDDDFNTPSAFAALFELINKINPLLSENKLSSEATDGIKNFFRKVDSILGIVPEKKEEVPAEITKLVEKREDLRKDKNWAEADKIRAQIKDMGYDMEDTIYGPFLTKSYTP